MAAERPRDASAAAGAQLAGHQEPQLHLSTLDRGLRVASEQVPGLRSVALGFWIATGSAFEQEGQGGISHLLEHMLFRGSASYSSAQIDEIFDELGSGLNAETDKETTAVTCRVLDTHLQRAFDVIGEMVFQPAMSELEAEREVVLQEIAGYEDDPADQVFERFSEAIFGEHPLGRPVIGTAETVAAISGDDLWRYHEASYIPERVVIAAAGSVEHEQLVGLANAALDRAAGRLGPAAAGKALARPAASLPAERVRFSRKDTEQFHVCIGAPAIERDDERRFALRVLEVLLGGTPSSRLFQEVRERRGLAYAVHSFSSLFSVGGESGVYIGTRPEKLAEALLVTYAELRRVAEEPIAEQELWRARECTKSASVLALESSGARMGRIGSSLLFDMPVLSLSDLIERIDAVDAQACAEIARELLSGERLAVAAIGPDEECFARALEGLRREGLELDRPAGASRQGSETAVARASRGG